MTDFMSFDFLVEMAWKSALISGAALAIAAALRFRAGGRAFGGAEDGGGDDPRSAADRLAAAGAAGGHRRPIHESAPAAPALLPAVDALPAGARPGARRRACRRRNVGRSDAADRMAVARRRGDGRGAAARRPVDPAALDPERDRAGPPRMEPRLGPRPRRRRPRPAGRPARRRHRLADQLGLAAAGDPARPRHRARSRRGRRGPRP